jgi:hypothetical protein
MASVGYAVISNSLSIFAPGDGTKPSRRATSVEKKDAGVLPAPPDFVRIGESLLHLFFVSGKDRVFLRDDEAPVGASAANRKAERRRNIE